MTKTFTHLVAAAEKDYIPFNTDAPSTSTIEMNVDAKGNFSLVADREGFLHLARVFAEMGLRELPNDFHFHKNPHFKFHIESAEFTFSLVDGV